MEDEYEILECVGCGEPVRWSSAMEPRCEPCGRDHRREVQASWLRHFAAMHPAPADTGVEACPVRAHGCAGPDKPWPCAVCKQEHEAAQALAAGEAGQVNVEASRVEVMALLGGVL